MLLAIIKFELVYRLRRPATYIYFAILFLLPFLAAVTDVIQIGGGVGQVKQDASVVINSMMSILTIVLMVICSGIMGVPIVRDFEHNTASMIFTSPIRKRDYFFGRFIGSFLIAIFVFSGMLFGFLFGHLSPWAEADKLLPGLNLMNYLWPFLTMALPNLFFASALFFAGGALSRNMLLVYTQGILLMVLYLVSNQLMSDLDSQFMASLLDPFGGSATRYITQYWTIAEQNSQLIPLSGIILYNRLLWSLVGFGILEFTYWQFDFRLVKGKKGSKKKQEISQAEDTGNAYESIPQATQTLNTRGYLRQSLNLSKLYFHEISRSVLFWAIAIAGFGILFINSQNFFEYYNTPKIPSTYAVLELIQQFNAFFIIIIVFFGGELIWRERDVKMNLIYDALPIPNWVGLVAKFLSMIYVNLVLMGVLILTGMLIQASKGYFHFELPVYLQFMFGEVFTFFVQYTLLIFFIQIIANHKFLGHALAIIFFVAMLVLPQLNIEHSLFSFGSQSLGRYSDMNHFGHYTLPFSWFSAYWTAFALLLFAGSVLLSVRGADTLLKTRFFSSKYRMTRPFLIFSFSAIALFLFSAFYIYYNTNILNEYASSDTRQEQQADYEKTLKQYEGILQPKIVETNMKVDVFPENRSFQAEGYYILKNKSRQAIKEIHIQQNPDHQFQMESLVFTSGADIAEKWEDFGYYIYQLDEALQPNDSLRMDFKMSFKTEGFVESGSNTSIVHNGTFFNNTYFPSLGYSDAYELSQQSDRDEYDLPEKELLPDPTDSLARTINLFGNDADRIRFEIVMSTSPDQIAIAPGYLQKEWEENDRRYFHYKMDKPMVNFYSMVSARYEVMEEEWNGIKLEIYYHPTHQYNLDRMMQAMKNSFSYYQKNFSPYQYKQMRIMEFPRYRSFAQSFANTVPFSEDLGFVLDIDEDDPDQVDVAFYVTAHEMAHQWWGHQVTEASVKGSAMLSESMSQYSALMVMKQAYPEEMMQRFLKEEMSRYLRGRRSEQRKEQPLNKVEAQSYIHYRKGSVVFYALQDYISEDSVNKAIRMYLDEWAWREDRYPAPNDLIKHIRAVTPDSLQYIIEDMFETITLFENRVEEPTYEELENGKYAVNIPIRSTKYRADSLGNEQSIPLQDWIDIGVYGESKSGQDSLLYLQKHKIETEEMEIRVELKAKPIKAGIDPINKLIDRNPNDNVKSVKMKE